jgi:hypothetical protein
MQSSNNVYSLKTREEEAYVSEKHKGIYSENKENWLSQKIEEVSDFTLIY